MAINKNELDDLYDEVDLWIQNEEPYYKEFERVKHNYLRIRNLVNRVIGENDFSQYKTSIMYRNSVAKRLREEYKE